MPTERMEEVEVVCPRHRPSVPGTRKRCLVCGNHAGYPSAVPGIIEATPAPGSLTSARLRLADAAEAYYAAQGDERGEWDEMVDAFKSLAALRTARGNNTNQNGADNG